MLSYSLFCTFDKIPMILSLTSADKNEVRMLAATATTMTYLAAWPPLHVTGVLVFYQIVPEYVIFGIFWLSLSSCIQISSIEATSTAKYLLSKTRSSKYYREQDDVFTVEGMLLIPQLTYTHEWVRKIWCPWKVLHYNRFHYH